MTSKQFLDAISCPRNNPTQQGKQVMSSEEDSSTDDETETEREDDEDDGATYSEDETVSEGGTIYEYLPANYTKPENRRMEVDIEKTCRLICMVSKDKRTRYEDLITEKKGHLPRFTFMNPGDKFNKYFRWRLEKNEKGQGIGPEWDVVDGSQQVKAGRNKAMRT